MQQQRGPRQVAEEYVNQQVLGYVNQRVLDLRATWDVSGDISVQEERPDISKLCDSTGNLLSTSVMFGEKPRTRRVDRVDEVTEEELDSEDSDVSNLNIPDLPEAPQDGVAIEEAGDMVEQEQGRPPPPARRTCSQCRGPVEPGRVSVFCSTKCKSDDKRLSVVLEVPPAEAVPVQPPAGGERPGRRDVAKSKNVKSDEKNKAKELKEAEVQPAARRRQQPGLKEPAAKRAASFVVAEAPAPRKRKSRCLRCHNFAADYVLCEGCRAVARSKLPRPASKLRAPKSGKDNLIHAFKSRKATAKTAMQNGEKAEKDEQVKVVKAKQEKAKRVNTGPAGVDQTDGHNMTVQMLKAEARARGLMVGGRKPALLARLGYTAVKQKPKEVKAKQVKAGPAGRKAAPPEGTGFNQTDGQNMTVPMLKVEARARGLMVGGRKPALLARLGYTAATKERSGAKERSWGRGVARRDQSSSISRSLAAGAGRAGGAASFAERLARSQRVRAEAKRLDDELLEWLKVQAWEMGLPTTGSMEDLRARTGN